MLCSAIVKIKQSNEEDLPHLSIKKLFQMKKTLRSNICQSIEMIEWRESILFSFELKNKFHWRAILPFRLHSLHISRNISLFLGRNNNWMFSSKWKIFWFYFNWEGEKKRSEERCEGGGICWLIVLSTDRIDVMWCDVMNDTSGSWREMPWFLFKVLIDWRVSFNWIVSLWSTRISIEKILHSRKWEKRLICIFIISFSSTIPCWTVCKWIVFILLTNVDQLNDEDISIIEDHHIFIHNRFERKSFKWRGDLLSFKGLISRMKRFGICYHCEKHRMIWEKSVHPLRKCSSSKYSNDWKRISKFDRIDGLVQWLAYRGKFSISSGIFSPRSLEQQPIEEKWKIQSSIRQIDVKNVIFEEDWSSPCHIEQRLELRWTETKPLQNKHWRNERWVINRLWSKIRSTRAHSFIIHYFAFCFKYVWN